VCEYCALTFYKVSGPLAKELNGNKKIKKNRLVGLRKGVQETFLQLHRYFCYISITSMWRHRGSTM
jgi:hypothetical protein